MDLASAQDALDLDNHTVNTGSSSENINMARLVDQAELYNFTSPRKTDRRRTLAPLDYKFNSLQLENSSSSNDGSMCSTTGASSSSSKSFASIEQTLKLSKSTKKSWKPKGRNVHQRLKPTVLDGHDGVLSEAAQSSDQCLSPERVALKLCSDIPSQDENDEDSLLKTNEKEETLPQSALSDLTWQSNSPVPIIELPPESESDDDLNSHSQTLQSPQNTASLEKRLTNASRVEKRKRRKSVITSTNSKEKVETNKSIQTETHVGRQTYSNDVVEKDNNECPPGKDSKVSERMMERVSEGGSLSKHSMQSSICTSSALHSSPISRPVRRSRQKLPPKYDDYEVAHEIQRNDSAARLTPLPEKETLVESDIQDEESEDILGALHTSPSISDNAQTPTMCIVDSSARRSRRRSVALKLPDYTDSTTK
jgi:hypothetical protein